MTCQPDCDLKGATSVPGAASKAARWNSGSIDPRRKRSSPGLPLSCANLASGRFRAEPQRLRSEATLETASEVAPSARRAS
eukprot:CAMPEP_0196703942 /NCGR_PEP_ID=MMETSP1090-20130531/56944_1 /TAXON_ID=37098 /ORGANISM="Isochrysis sp, Strain CCMP1244" /LENGTH=80 /DNA_ID=CAMNT_0042043819 /DNA_START=173 /DNA_END=415 /DNA_ORIENTATION=-